MIKLSRSKFWQNRAVRWARAKSKIFARIELMKSFDALDPIYCLKKLIRQTTNPIFNIIRKCPNCNIIFKPKILKQKFCCIDCANKKIQRDRKIKRLKTFNKLCTNEILKKFISKYNDFVYSEIFKYPSQYHEHMIDYYSEEMPVLAYKTRYSTGAQNFLKIAIRYYYLLSKNKYGKEIGYEDCNIATQYKILGEYNESNY